MRAAYHYIEKIKWVKNPYKATQKMLTIHIFMMLLKNICFWHNKSNASRVYNLVLGRGWWSNGNFWNQNAQLCLMNLWKYKCSWIRYKKQWRMRVSQKKVFNKCKIRAQRTSRDEEALACCRLNLGVFKRSRERYCSW